MRVELFKGRHRPRATPSTRLLAAIQFALTKLDPDCDYEEWFRIGAAIYNATDGSDDGFELYDTWSAEAHYKKYPGRRTMERRWEYYDKPQKRPITIGTLHYYLKQAGSSWAEVLEHVDKFYGNSEEGRHDA
jgi:hypothetical protein